MTPKRQMLPDDIGDLQYDATRDTKAEAGPPQPHEDPPRSCDALYTGDIDD